MFETGTKSRDKRFEKFSVFANFCQKAKCRSTDIFIRMLLYPIR